MSVNQILNIAGMKFGKITAIRLAEKHERLTTSNGSSAQWYCRCDCGTEFVTRRNMLRKSSQSCGCRAVENARKVLKARRPEGVLSAVRRKYNAYTFNAKKRKVSFELTFEEFSVMIQKNCHHCGQEPNQVTCIYRSKDSENTLIHNGIDRLDSNLGYTISNSVPCCGTCNAIKWSLTEDQWIAHMQKVLKHKGIT